MNESFYEPWLRAEEDALTVVSDGHYLKRVEIPRGEIFDSFQEELNEENLGVNKTSENRIQENIKTDEFSENSMVEDLVTCDGKKSKSNEGWDLEGESNLSSE